MFFKKKTDEKIYISVRDGNKIICNKWISLNELDKTTKFYEGYTIKTMTKEEYDNLLS